MKKKHHPQRTGHRTATHHAARTPSYRLHIDAMPHHVMVRQAHHDKAHHVRRSRSRAALWIWDKVQFVLVSAVVFIVIYVVLNWPAIQLNIVHYWNVWRGIKSPLEELVKERTAEPERLFLSDRPAASVNSIAPLNLEIYPPDTRLVIPRINQNVPVVGVRNENLVARKWEELEADIQKALKNGVIHYPGTSLPGENGNIVVTGHSSYYAWDPGRFKDVFALLHDVKMGDRIVMYFNQKKFIYEVENIKIVTPDKVDVLGPTNSEKLTLITCTPIGTNLKRLILTARLVEKS